MVKGGSLVLRLNLRPNSAAVRRRRWVTLLLTAGALGLGACSRAEPSELPQVLVGVPLTDQNGARLGAAELSGETLLLNFMFTSCSVVCGRQTQALKEVRAALPDAVRERARFVSVSVDPENDGPASLKRFAIKHGADVPGWSFVRSDELHTHELTARLTAFEPGSGDRPPPSAHTLGLYLFDRTGRLVQRYAGSPIDTQRIARELVALDQLKPSEARLASR